MVGRSDITTHQTKRDELFALVSGGDHIFELGPEAGLRLVI